MATADVDVPEMYNGDRMTQGEFHRIYEQMPEDFRAELIGGIVYVASPLKIRHGNNHPPLSTLFFLYQSATAGTEAGDNTTVILGEDAEPQPDLYLRILPEYGGRTTTRDDYVIGGPELMTELMTEIALSSRSVDLHAKKDDYARYGVLEYLVLCVRERKLRWFDLRAHQELQADADGVMRIRCFPGLWIHVEGLLAQDADKMLATLNVGLASPEHRAFVRDLAARQRS
jgi:Uma2 family endonuclease